jgi:hypothetical protein
MKFLSGETGWDGRTETSFTNMYVCVYYVPLNKNLQLSSEKIYLFFSFLLVTSMLSGLLVPTAWRVLRLRMEETASRYGWQLRIYCMNCHRQPTTGGPAVGAFGLGLTTLHFKK